jgi:HlyD family secretion protein
MSALRSRPARLGLIVAAVLLLAVALFGFRGERVRVDSATAQQQELIESLREEGRTRLAQRWRLMAPVAGQVARIDLRPGDRIEAGQVLAVISPAAGALLDPATRERLRNEARASAAGVAQAHQRVLGSRAAQKLAEQELARIEPLVKNGTLSKMEGERVVSRLDQARAELRAANYAEALASAQQAASESLLAQQGQSGGAQEPVTVTAPVPGVVLARLRESAGPVALGEALLEIGDPRSLEIEVDLLSSDAVRVAEGMDVRLHRWGGEAPLAARVRRVEPAGFTKISALGVEEQRVWVLCDLTSPPEEWQRLGDAYRVEAEFILSQGSALTVPSGALFRRGQDWVVYTIAGERTHETKVRVGRRGGLDSEILEGLKPGDRVVVHPDDRVGEGTRIALL